MNHPPSRLLQRLDAEIARLGECVESDCLRAEKACYFARQGRFAEATTALEELQAKYKRRPRSEISAWVNLAEGLHHHFEHMVPLARDKILRSQAIAGAVGLDSVDALASAWLAQLDYARTDFVGMDRNLRRTFLKSTPAGGAALTRGSLVMAQALHYSGRIDLAKRWYNAAHDCAVADGDDASISARMHNMAWLRLVNRRQAIFASQDVAAGDAHALLSAHATEHYDALIGARSLQHLTPLLQAQALTLDGLYAEALELFEREVPTALSSGLQQWYSTLLAEQAWCNLRSGRLDAARQQAEEAASVLNPDGHFDDTAPVHSRLAQLFAELGERRLSESHAMRARECWAGYARTQAQIISLVSDIEPTSGSKSPG